MLKHIHLDYHAKLIEDSVHKVIKTQKVGQLSNAYLVHVLRVSDGVYIIMQEMGFNKFWQILHFYWNWKQFCKRISHDCLFLCFRWRPETWEAMLTPQTSHILSLTAYSTRPEPALYLFITVFLAVIVVLICSRKLLFVVDSLLLYTCGLQYVFTKAVLSSIMNNRNSENELHLIDIHDILCHHWPCK